MVLLPVAIQAPKGVSPAGLIYDIEIAPGDKWMAVSTSSDNIWIYTLQGKLIRTLHHKKGSHLVDIEISPDGKYLACSNQNYSGDYCPVWSTSTWKEISKVGIWITKSFCDPPSSIEFAGGGKFLVGTTIFSHELFCWNTKTGAIEYIARKTHFGYYGFAINANSSLAVLYEASTQRLRFWDFGDSGKIRDWGPDIQGIEPRFVKNMHFSHDGQRLFIVTLLAHGYSNFNILKPLHGRTVVAFQDQVRGLQVRDLAWAGDDSLIWACGLNGQIVCFDPSSGTLLRHWTGHNHLPIHALAATHHGHTVVTAAAYDICVWDGDSGKLIRTIKLSPS